MRVSDETGEGREKNKSREKRNAAGKIHEGNTRNLKEYKYKELK